MKFTKGNNPNRRRKATSRNDVLRRQLEQLLAEAKTEQEKEYILKAYDISLRP